MGQTSAGPDRAHFWGGISCVWSLSSLVDGDGFVEGSSEARPVWCQARSSCVTACRTFMFSVAEQSKSGCPKVGLVFSILLKSTGLFAQETLRTE